MDQIQALRAFQAVAQELSFSRAADKLGLSTQLVSKQVAQLEDRIQTRLLHRTTRRVALTEAGQDYLLRCQRLLKDLDDLDASVMQQADKAEGTLRLNAPMSFGVKHLSPAISRFQAQHPRLQVDLSLTDRRVNLVEEGIDLALRIGKLEDSSLIARYLTPIRLVTCASPTYLAKYGEPRKPEDLSGHRYLHYRFVDIDAPWLSAAPNGYALKQQSPLVADNGDALCEAAIEGTGIVVQPTFIVSHALAKGELVEILREYAPQTLGLYAVYPHRQYLNAKVRLFLQFLESAFGNPPYWDQPA